MKERSFQKLKNITVFPQNDWFSELSNICLYMGRWRKSTLMRNYPLRMIDECEIWAELSSCVSNRWHSWWADILAHRKISSATGWLTLLVSESFILWTSQVNILSYTALASASRAWYACSTESGVFTCSKIMSNRTC